MRGAKREIMPQSNTRQQQTERDTQVHNSSAQMPHDDHDHRDDHDDAQDEQQNEHNEHEPMLIIMIIIGQ